MSRIDEIISNALAGIKETEVAILARELLKTRKALAQAQQAKGEAEGRAALLAREVVELRGEVAKLKQAPAVVVPELTAEERDAIFPAPDLAENEQQYREFWRVFDKAFAVAASRSRAIHADRVLGEGMVAVDQEEWEAVQAFAVAWFAGRPDGEVHDASSAWFARRQALRANQGGAT